MASISGFELLEDQVTPGPAEQLEVQETLALLRDAIDRLPERERLLLAMYYQEELTMKEISDVIVLPVFYRPKRIRTFGLILPVRGCHYVLVAKVHTSVKQAWTRCSIF